MPRGTTRSLGQASPHRVEQDNVGREITAPPPPPPLRFAGLRSGSGGSAIQLATKENRSALNSRCRGTSVSPLDKTYHGGPQTKQNTHPLINMTARLRSSHSAEDRGRARTFSAGQSWRRCMYAAF